jgi:hypothetical protein
MKIEVIIPSELSEITLDQYQRYLKITEKETDEGFLRSKMLEIFCNIKLTDTLKMKLGDVNAITEILNEMFESKPKLVQRFKMKGIEYGFIPNLDDISLGEYIDLDSFLGDWDNMHRAMAVLYRPIKQKYGERYNIEEYQVGDGEVMKDMPMDAVISSVLFFYHLGIDLSQAMMNYLEDSQETRLVQYLSSDKSGAGINQFTHSLKEILQDLRISLN